MKANDSASAVILLAGRGRRLGHVTKNIPKCLLEIGGYPIVHHQLLALRNCGIKDIVLVTGFKDEAVKEYVQAHFQGLNLKFIYNPDFDTTNTLYSLALASQFIGKGRQVLQLNGDVLFDEEILKLLLKADGSKSYIATQEKKCGKEEVKVAIARAGTISFLNKTIAPHRALGEAIGINKFSSSFWDKLHKHLQLMKNRHADKYFEYAVEHAMKRGADVHPFLLSGLKAIEIDYRRDFTLAQKMFPIKLI